MPVLSSQWHLFEKPLLYTQHGMVSPSCHSGEIDLVSDDNLTFQREAKPEQVTS